jgi:putative phosphoesterase
MRILLIADVHANWPALQAAAAEPHDVCLFLGDLVDYALEPAPCVAWVRENARYAVRGNHDHGAAQNVIVNGLTGYKYLTGVTRPLTRERLQETDLRFLSRLPATCVTTLENTRFLLVHATPRDPLDEYAPPDVEFWSRRLRNVDADVVCVGHTHLPYVLEVGDKLVINPGSVGLPRDGDPRASYAVIENYKVDVKKVEYPVEDTVSVIEASALPDIAKEMLAEALRTGAAPNGLVKPSLPESYRDVPNGEEPPAHTQNGDHRPHSESKTVE